LGQDGVLGLRLHQQQQVRLTSLAIAAFVSTLPVPFRDNAASAAGFALREYSLTTASTSFAGASAGTGSPDFLAHNPASSMDVVGWDMQVTANAIHAHSDASFDIATTSTGAALSGSYRPDGFIQNAIEPGLAFRMRLSEDWTAGLSVSAPWGLGTLYDRNWAGRYYAVESRLLTVNASPTITWQPTDTLAISGGLQVQYAQGVLSNAIDFGTIGAGFGVPGALPGQQDGFAEFEATDWATGYRLGLIWKPVDTLSLGLAHRSQVSHTLKGDVAFTLDTAGIGTTLAGLSGAFTNTSAAARLDLPSVTSAGFSWKATDALTLLGEVSYTDWSTTRELRIRFDNPLQPDSYQTYDWSDAWMISAGASYDVSPEWTLRAGAAIDETPTTDATRDARIPDATRTWLSFSVEHHITPTASVQLGYAKLMFPEEPIALSAATAGNETRGNLVGTTDADADMISIQPTLR
jgi:long-chain fatty acid transport protein